MSQRRLSARQSAEAAAARVPEPSLRLALAALLALLVAAATLRLVQPGLSPPGMNVDEAAEIWNAWCLHKTGADQHGVPWPIFRARCFGDIDNRSPLFLYWLQPFLAVGGMSLETARFSSAVAGMISIALMYYIATQLFGRGTALATAALLAVNPWHLQQSRWAHQAALQPMLVAASLAALLWAGFPFGGRPRPVRVWAAPIAGAITGLSCYGYQSTRVFLPLFLAGVVLVNARTWWSFLRDRRGLVAFLLMIAAASALFVPLLYQHLTDPAMHGRGEVTRLWNPEDSWATRAAKSLGRYWPHYGLDFLFRRGDQYYFLFPPAGYGLFLWYSLPLMALGAWWLVLRWKTATARLALVWAILYPAGDLFASHISAHALRSLPGLGGLILLTGVGLSASLAWLWSRHRALAALAAALFIMPSGAMTVNFLDDFYTSFNRQTSIYQAYFVDLVQALDWLRPEFDKADAVILTASNIPHPYIYAAVRLGYDPARWMKEEKLIRKGPVNGAHPGEDVYVRVGKIYVNYGQETFDKMIELQKNGRDDRVILILRPGELTNAPPGLRPLREYRDPQGAVTLQIHELKL
jgi:4-amino-4-deoxy-L-arabinose transferase-like glycosyltransferase